MAQTRICKVPDAVHKRVMAVAEESGISFAAALEVLLQRGEDATRQLERQGLRTPSSQSYPVQAQRVAIPTASAQPARFGSSIPSNQGGTVRIGVK